MNAPCRPPSSSPATTTSPSTPTIRTPTARGRGGWSVSRSSPFQSRASARSSATTRRARSVCPRRRLVDSAGRTSYARSMTTAQVQDPWRGVDLFDPAVRDDPYPVLARLRETDPVNETPMGIWQLTRYDDVDRLLHAVPAGVRTTTGELPGVDEQQVGPRRFMLHQD